jgi:hypothetical protein
MYWTAAVVRVGWGKSRMNSYTSVGMSVLIGRPRAFA